MLREVIINGALLPAIAAIIFLALAAISGRGWLQAATIAAAVIAASVGLRGLPSLSPDQALGWIPVLSVAALGVAIWSERLKNLPLRWILRFSFIVIGVAVLLEPMRDHAWSSAQAAMWEAGLAVLMCAAWIVIERLLPGRPEAPQALILTIAIGGGAAAVAGLATLVVGIHAGAAATAMGLFTLYTWRSGRPGAPEVIATLVPITGFIWIIAYVYAAIPGASMLLIAAAPILALTTSGLGRRLRRPRAAVALGPALAALTIAAAILVAQIPTHLAVDDVVDGDSQAYYPY